MLPGLEEGLPVNHRAGWVFVTFLVVTVSCGAPPVNKGDAAPPDVERPSGLIVKKPGASPGFVLYSPLLSDTTYLIDADGLVVHTWKSQYAPNGSVDLLENGRLLRGARVESKVFNSGGTGGLIEELTWDGEVAWSFPFATDDHI